MIGGVAVNVVPSLLGVQHDNPEGRDQIGLMVSNHADQTCQLCYAPSATCADNTLDTAALKHLCLFTQAREEARAANGNKPGICLYI